MHCIVRLLSIFLFAVLVTGCGAKGDLVKPAPEPAKTAAAVG